MLGYYLKQGDTDPAVIALKKCINASLASPRPLGEGPTFDAETRAALCQLQNLAGLTADGVAGPRTWALLGRKLGYSIFSIPALSLSAVPGWARNLLLNDPASTSPRGIDAALAVELYEKVLGRLGDASKRAGLTFLLGKLAADDNVADIRWAVYILATVKHECADKWQPIDEDQTLWSQHAYGNEVEVKDPAGNTYKNRYYGRGYVQLTLQKNYKGMGKNLGYGDDLFYHPEKVKEPELAYRIISYGMLNGSFNDTNQFGLRQYISGASCDYVAARATVNTKGDQAERIAGYARDFEVVLLGAVTNTLGVVLGGASAVLAW